MIKVLFGFNQISRWVWRSKSAQAEPVNDNCACKVCSYWLMARMK